MWAWLSMTCNLLERSLYFSREMCIKLLRFNYYSVVHNPVPGIKLNSVVNSSGFAVIFSFLLENRFKFVVCAEMFGNEFAYLITQSPWTCNFDFQPSKLQIRLLCNRTFAINRKFSIERIHPKFRAANFIFWMPVFFCVWWQIFNSIIIQFYFADTIKILFFTILQRRW